MYMLVGDASEQVDNNHNNNTDSSIDCLTQLSRHALQCVNENTFKIKGGASENSFIVVPCKCTDWLVDLLIDWLIVFLDTMVTYYLILKVTLYT